MGHLSVIVGGQYGSEAKGSVCAHLVRRNRDNNQFSIVVRVAGPNAGHTAYDNHGNAWALRQVPVGMIVDPKAFGVIADGSEVDLPVLLREVAELDAAGLNVGGRITVSGMVTFLTDEHHDRETALNLHGKIGSTGKGIGAARSDRVMRWGTTPLQVLTDHRANGAPMFERLLKFARNNWVELADLPDTDPLMVALDRIHWEVNGTARLLQNNLRLGAHVMIEGTQGYGLGVHRPEYPRVTSSDTRAIDFLAMAGVNPWDPGVDEFDVWMVVRAFPIRVAGNSGPLVGETSWDDLGLPVELTTVTKKPRRVGTWDPNLYRDALAANGGRGVVKVAYSMADQEAPAIAGLNGPLSSFDLDNTPGLQRELTRITQRLGMMPSYIGTGPNTIVWMD